MMRFSNRFQFLKKYWIQVAVAIACAAITIVLLKPSNRAVIERCLKIAYYTPQKEKKHNELRQALRESARIKNYTQFLAEFQKQINICLTLDELEGIAQEQKNRPLLNAFRAAALIQEKTPEVLVTKLELFQAALFMETQFPNYIKTRTYYLPQTESKLAFDLEYDPITRQRFIHLAGKQGAKIGKGQYKLVTKSVLYDSKSPEIVARALQEVAKKRELTLTKLFKGKDGLFEIKAITARRHNSEIRYSIFMKIYNAGSLQSVFEKNIKFTMAEKMTMALSIIKGISAMHKKNIVHRDLGARNYLVDISDGEPGKRTVTAVVADLGRAVHEKSAAHTKPQGNTTYTAPEAVLRDKMTGKDYYSSDIYAAGCVLYQLFHDQKAPWRKSFLRMGKKPDAVKKEMSDAIIACIAERKAELDKLIESGKSRAQDDFEHLILSMCDVEPQKRGTIDVIEKKMQMICDRMDEEQKANEHAYLNHPSSTLRPESAISLMSK